MLAVKPDSPCPGSTLVDGSRLSSNVPCPPTRSNAGKTCDLVSRLVVEMELSCKNKN